MSTPAEQIRDFTRRHGLIDPPKLPMPPAKKVWPGITREQLDALLPDAAVETVDGELVIYTGWAQNPEEPDGPLVDWDPDVHGDAVPTQGDRWDG
jgi:hypothetical protein